MPWSVPRKNWSAFDPQAFGATDRQMLLFFSRFLDVAVVALILSAFT